MDVRNSSKDSDATRDAQALSPTGNATSFRSRHCQSPNRQRLHYYTMGGMFRAVWALQPGDAGGVEVRWPDEQTRTLMKYLLAAPDFCRSCEQIIELLWPEIDPARGREYLRSVGSRLRHALEPERAKDTSSYYIVKTREHMALTVEGANAHGRGAWLDAQVFEQAANEALEAFRSGMDGRALGNVALSYYSGAFLPLDLYSDWTRMRRRHYRRLRTMLLRQVAQAEANAGDFDRAALLLSQCVEEMPDDEDAVYRLMVVEAAAGRRAAALRHYDELRAHLDLLGLQPAERLIALRMKICAGQSVDIAQHQLNTARHAAGNAL